MPALLMLGCSTVNSSTNTTRTINSMQAEFSCGNLALAHAHFIRWSNGLVEMKRARESLPIDKKKRVLRSALGDSVKDLMLLDQVAPSCANSQIIVEVFREMQRFDDGIYDESKILDILTSLQVNTEATFKSPKVASCFEDLNIDTRPTTYGL